MSSFGTTLCSTIVQYTCLTEGIVLIPRCSKIKLYKSCFGLLTITEHGTQSILDLPFKTVYMRCTPLLYPSTVELSTLPLVPSPASVPLQSHQIILHIKLSRLPGASETRRDGRTDNSHPHPLRFLPVLISGAAKLFFLSFSGRTLLSSSASEKLWSQLRIFFLLLLLFLPPLGAAACNPTADHRSVAFASTGGRLATFGRLALAGSRASRSKGKKGPFHTMAIKSQSLLCLRLSSPNGRDRQTGGVGGKMEKKKRGEERESGFRREREGEEEEASDRRRIFRVRRTERREGKGRSLSLPLFFSKVTFPPLVLLDPSAKNRLSHEVRGDGKHPTW